jgi:hypothetical protein
MRAAARFVGSQAARNVVARTQRCAIMRPCKSTATSRHTVRDLLPRSFDCARNPSRAANCAPPAKLLLDPVPIRAQPVKGSP